MNPYFFSVQILFVDGETELGDGVIDLDCKPTEETFRFLKIEIIQLLARRYNTKIESVTLLRFNPI